DFRAGERTFQLVAQVAGRAGRGPRGGLVFVQTRAPDHHAIRAAAAHSVAQFAAAELPLRSPPNPPYPPRTGLVRFVVSGTDHAWTADLAERVAAWLRRASSARLDGMLTVLGPAPCPLMSGAPEARFTPAPADGVLPDGFFSTTNLPTYVKLPPPTGWRRPRLPRMDCVIVQAGPDDLVVSEPRRVRRGDKVAVGAAEDGSEGIFVHVEGFLGGTHSPNEFRFMAAEVSRERPVDYGVLAQLLGEEKERGGKMLWVIGPALVHARAREDMIWFIENGYVSVLFGGNAVA